MKKTTKVSIALCTALGIMCLPGTSSATIGSIVYEDATSNWGNIELASAYDQTLEVGQSCWTTEQCYAGLVCVEVQHGQFILVSICVSGEDVDEMDADESEVTYHLKYYVREGSNGEW